MDNIGQWLLIAVLVLTALVLWRAEIVAGLAWLWRKVRPLPAAGPPVAGLFGGGGSPAAEAPDWWPVNYWSKFWWPISYWPKVGTNIVAAAAAAADDRPRIRMDVRHRRGR
mgnify:CR=1 FL=1